MQINQLKEELKQHILLMDGAMGTYFNYLHPEDGEVELANLTHPEWIEEIHFEYIRNGARIIRTNTFAINHTMFSDETYENAIVAAIECANRAVFKANMQDIIYIAGSIGPIRMEPDHDRTDLLAEYKKICDCMLSHGIRIFVLETFSDVQLAKSIATYIKQSCKEHYASETFLQAQFSVNRMGYTLYGQSLDTLIKETEDCSYIDGFGLNCGIGAAHMNTLLEKAVFNKDIYLSVLPNAGYEQGLHGRHFLINNMNYYASAMETLLSKGVNLIGGCCGTTPAHIKSLATMLQTHQQPVSKETGMDHSDSDVLPAHNKFIEKLNQGEPVYVVEIDSPFNGNATKFLSGAKQLVDNDVDLITISDSPMAKARADAFQMGNYIAAQTGAHVMPHICCRDRNLIGLRSSMLGAHINGMRDMLIITGDPVTRDSRSTITGVFDMNSIRLMEYVRNMNEELFADDPFYYGGALNYAGVNIDSIANRMQKKMDAGCSYFLTQPVFSDSDIERIKELKAMTNAKIIVGLMPLVSHKNAMYMKNEMPGINVPDDIINQYYPEMSREEATDIAIRICVSIGEKLKGHVDGFYLMTPFNRVDIINAIICQLRQN
ncbi:MAG: bifunctional homocysteine S-methyltransferase/methylenetetrahydrofolate reductase [Eubacteriales bacterium]|nr:bifunctional homocysteine S-methyltransferase/methylenetetrahydrofolate reductase [Eubacteriales bacterium]